MKVLIDGKDPLSCDTKTIHEAFGVLKNASRTAQQKKTAEFYVGQRVSWDSKKRGKMMIGIIERINITSITIIPIDNPYATWKVAPSLLTPDEAKLIRGKEKERPD